MTEYEYYMNDKDKISELVEKVELIQNACKHYGFDFHEMMKGFLNSEHIDIESEKVERDSDTTVVVNVGLTFNLHDVGEFSNDTAVSAVKECFEKITKDIIYRGIHAVTSRVQRSEHDIPDSITFGNTQVFYFDGGYKHD